tara:strand:- start:47 stop:676 length:630 start_codon:yes stop_codon:yes gene_type:complete
LQKEREEGERVMGYPYPYQLSREDLQAKYIIDGTIQRGDITYFYKSGLIEYVGFDDRKIPYAYIDEIKAHRECIYNDALWHSYKRDRIRYYQLRHQDGKKITDKINLELSKKEHGKLSPWEINEHKKSKWHENYKKSKQSLKNVKIRRVAESQQKFKDLDTVWWHKEYNIIADAELKIANWSFGLKKDNLYQYPDQYFAMHKTVSSGTR